MSVVGLADAVGFGLGDVGADGWGALAVRATVTAVRRSAAVVEVTGFAEVTAGPEVPVVADGVPVTAADEVGTDVVGAASLQTSSAAPDQSLDDAPVGRAADGGSPAPTTSRTPTRAALSTAARPMTEPMTRLRRWRACRRSVRVSGDMATQRRR
jgi:hypothetical protein